MTEVGASRELPVTRGFEEVARGLVRTFGLSMFTANREVMRGYKGLELLAALGHLTEVAGVAMTATGIPLGPAVFVAGKVESVWAERWAKTIQNNRRRLVQDRWARMLYPEEHIKNIPLPAPVGAEHEGKLVGAVMKLADVAAKVAIPAPLSRPKWYDSEGYRRLAQKGRLMIWAATSLGVSVLAGVHLGTVRPEWAAAAGMGVVGMFAAGQALSVLAEAGDRTLPWAKQKIEAVKKKAKNIVQKVDQGVSYIGKALQDDIGESRGAPRPAPRE